MSGVHKISMKHHAVRGALNLVKGALALVATTLAVGAGSVAQAQSYPERPVQLIIAYGAGSVGDVSMRVVAEKLSQKLGKPFVVENRPGAAGIVAAKGAMVAEPNGYTLLLTGNSYAISTAMFKSLPYNVVTDFAPISTVASFDMLVLTKAGSPLKSMQDVIDYAKKNPGKLNIGTLSAGTTQYLAVELLKVTAGVNVIPVPFRTSPDMATSLLRGDLDIALEFYAPVQSMIEDGKFKVIATTGKQRIPFMPDVPTVIEAGIKDFDVSSWNGIVAPAATPKPIVEQLSKAIIEVLKTPEVESVGRKLGMEMAGSTPAELNTKLVGDIKKWTDLQKAANLPKME